MGPLKKVPTKKKQAANPDFKRIKAKVGKKAPKPANHTDTSFKSASLHVRNQDVDTSANGAENQNKQLVSSRGRSIAELASQMGHPAIAVRISAAKGLKDVILSSPSGGLLGRHLASVVPFMSQCWVDEDETVRQLGLDILKHLLSKLTIASSEESVTRQPVVLLQPFASLLVAFALSSLNSLDDATRKDGADVVGQIARSLPTLVAPYCHSVLPALIPLLSASATSSLEPQPTDSDTQQPSTSQLRQKQHPSTSKKRKRLLLAPAIGKRQMAVLQTLQLLLESVATRGNDRIGTGQHDTPNTVTSSGPYAGADIEWTAGDQSPFAKHLGGITASPEFIWMQGPVNTSSHPVFNLRTLDSFASFVRSDRTISKASITNIAIGQLSNDAIYSLLSRLRDRLVEVTQKGHSFEKGMSLSTANLEAAKTIFTCLRLLWNFMTEQYPNGILQSQGIEADGKKTSKLETVILQLAGLHLECLPLNGEGETGTSLANATNAEIATLLVGMSIEFHAMPGKVTSAVPRAEKWIDRVAAHIELMLYEDLETIQEDPIASVSALSCRALLGVLKKLFLSKSGLTVVGTARRTSLVRAFVELFFESPSPTLAASMAGRQACLLVVSMFEEVDFAFGAACSSYGRTGMVRVLQDGIPFYLQHWEGNFPGESAALIGLLLQIARRLSSPTNASLLTTLKNRLEPLLWQSLNSEKSSIVESYPLELQRQTVGLIVMLQDPTSTTIQALGHLACRNRQNHQYRSQSFANYILHAAHSIRKQMPMSSYLALVIDSTAITAKSEPSETVWQHCRDLDAGLAEAASCLVECGTQKVFPMLQPLFVALLHDKDKSERQKIMQSRAAISFLALFSLDQKQSQPPFTAGSAQLSVFNLLADETSRFELVDRLLLKGLVHVLLAPYEWQSQSAKADRVAWERPCLVLLQSESHLFLPLVERLVSDLVNTDARCQNHMLELLLYLVQHAELQQIVTEISRTALPIVEQLDIQDGPSAKTFHQLVADLQVAAEIVS